MMIKPILACLAIFSLTSCSPPAPKIIAVVEDGKIIFHIRKSGFFFDKIFGWDDSAEQATGLILSANEEIYWQLGESDKVTSFPISYGILPPAIAQIIPPKKLPRNIKITVAAYEFYFNVNEQITRKEETAWGSFLIQNNGNIVNFEY